MFSRNASNEKFVAVSPKRTDTRRTNPSFKFSPFYYDISETQEELKCYFKSKYTSFVQVVFGVPMQDFFQLLSQKWATIVKSLTTCDEEMHFSKNCTADGPSMILFPDIKKCCKIQLPHDDSHNIHQRYPVVILMVLFKCKDLKYYRSEFLTAIVFEKCSFSEEKFLIMHLYRKSSSTCEVKTTISSTPAFGDERMFKPCEICYSEPSLVKFLPCLHPSLICRYCYEKVKKCITCQKIKGNTIKLPKRL